MADRSKIEWTDASINPIRARNLKTGKVGWHCEHATTGCEFCYSEGFNKRLGTGLPFKPGHRKDIEIFLDEQMLTQPLRWKKPRRIFVCSMTDAFADFVTDEMLDKMFAVAALCPQHTLQFLTKRTGRMREYIGRDVDWNAVLGASLTAIATHDRIDAARGAELRHRVADRLTWPLPNVWLGVSAERQQETDERVPELLATPAAVRFLSLEPLLGPIDLKRWVPTGSWGTYDGEPVYNSKFFLTKCEHCGWFGSSELCHEVSYGDDADVSCPSCRQIFMCDEVDSRIAWIIAGGESGRTARPMHPDWACGLRDQCHAANVAFFFKQFGEWAPSTPEESEGNPHSGWQARAAHPHVARAAELYPEAGAKFIARVGKAKAGRLLDGVEHNEFPKVPG
jgi:protein gp37